MDAYIGSIILLAFNWAPRDCALCNGAEMSINQNQALYSLLSNNFGGSTSKGTFGLPDLRGRVACSMGQSFQTVNRPFAEGFGTDYPALTVENLPEHLHSVKEIEPGKTVTVKASDAQANKVNPQGCYWAKSYSGTATTPSYSSTADVTMAADAVQLSVSNLTTGVTGGGTPFIANPPTLTLNYCIFITGMYPQRD
jgi:microcystin-dependent protein